MARTEEGANTLGQRWQGFAELRLIPRSNFLEQRYPLPLNQGYTKAWYWNGYHVWSDADTQAELLHGTRVTRRGNFEWTLNQAHSFLSRIEARRNPGPPGHRNTRLRDLPRRNRRRGKAPRWRGLPVEAAPRFEPHEGVAPQQRGPRRHRELAGTECAAWPGWLSRLARKAPHRLTSIEPTSQKRAPASFGRNG